MLPGLSFTLHSSSEPFIGAWTPPVQPLAADYRLRPCRYRCGSVQPKMAKPY
jgi:hypothetical protein